MEEEILKLLSESPGITTTDIARRLGKSRTTVISYLKILLSRGLLYFTKVGPAKLWYVKDDEAKKTRIKQEGAELSEVLKNFLSEAHPFEILEEKEKKVLSNAQKILKKVGEKESGAST